MHDRFGIGTADRTDRHVPGGLAAGVADRTGLQAGRAERMEQAVHQPAVHQALMGGVGVAQDGERAALADDGFPAICSLVERLIPGDGLELARALGPCAAKRGGDAFGRIHKVAVAVDLAAGKTGRVRLVGVTLDAHDLAVVDMCDERAHVGTIVGTDNSNGFHYAASRRVSRP